MRGRRGALERAALGCRRRRRPPLSERPRRERDDRARVQGWRSGEGVARPAPRRRRQERAIERGPRASGPRPRQGKGHLRLRDRLVFPVTDLEGRAIGFGGRALGHEPGPKYINTPETLLYKKSRVLYGISQAKDAIRKTGVAILVEGYFDVLLPHQAGIRNVVGVCGTALTPEHLELLKRGDCRELVILFDGDAAGSSAPPQVAAAIFQAGLSARVAHLTGDPDEYVRAHGRAGFEALIAAAPSLTEHLIDQAIQRHTGNTAATHASVEQKIAIVRMLTPHAVALPDGLARSAFERRIAQRLALDVGALRAEVQRLASEGRP